MARKPRKKTEPDEGRAAAQPPPDAMADHQLTEAEIDREFPLVGIGASAGGLQAFTRLLHALPNDTGMAFVVVQHMPPTHESVLAEILGRTTPMPCTQVQDEPRVEPNHVYVIPPDRNMILTDGFLRLVPRESGRGQNRPIDVFLRSLAEARKHKAIGVILSGTATDGTLGLEAIKSEGGITFAQDDTAQQTSMPRSAVASGCVDFELPPEEIAAELVRISRHPLVAPAPVHEVVEPSGGEAHLGRILEMLMEHTGVDFKHYKHNTLYRRITRRVVLHKLHGIAEYVKFLENAPREAEALYQDILISVTSFFRNPESVEALKESVFPKLVDDRSRHEPVRVWVLGCSTGEEAYTIAMAFAEYCETTGTHVPLQIFATDLNGAGIERARTGVYSRNITGDVSPERLRRFFVEIDGSYRVSKPIRDVCVFARHNVLTDPPFSRIDLVSCRNLLIYLEPSLQARVVSTFHYALRPRGFLWLGSSETIGSHRDLFDAVDPKHKIYSTKHGGPRIVTGHGQTTAGWQATHARSDLLRPPAVTPAAEAQKEADRMLLNRFAPPGVLVDANMDIVHFRGDTSPYLAPAPGSASLNILKMAREGLLVGLRAAIVKAKKEEASVRERGLRVKANGGYREVDVEVVPVRTSAPNDGCYLVTFETASGEEPPAATEPPPLERDVRAADADKQITRLTQELAATREYLQSVIEQQEAANEELQSANEEVQSANEELQSINEELETSKEEIQSSNEELATVNDELQNRNLELGQVNSDLVNLLASVQMPIVMLGRDLRTRRFTPAAEKLLNLIPSDIGRPITDIKLPVDSSVLERLLVETIDHVSVREQEVQDRSGRWYSLRIRPYKTLENQIDGAVLTFVDIDANKRAQEALQQSEEIYRLLVTGATGFAMMSLDRNGRIASWNVAAERMFGYTNDEAVGMQFSRLFTREDAASGRPKQLLARTETEEGVGDDLMLVRKDGNSFWTTGAITARRDADGEISGYSQIVHDVSDRKLLDDELRARVRELALTDRNRNEFLAMLAHELRNPLTPMRHALDLMKTPAADDGTRGEARDMIDRQLRHLSRLVDDLLDVARVTQGKIELKRGRVELEEVIERVVRDVRPRVDARKQRLTVSLPRRAIVLDGDAVRLEQVFSNLVSNATKFAEHGGRIGVTVERDSSDGTDEAVVRVADDGVGIEPELLSRVFDLFTQGDVSTQRSHDGLGIGLTLVKKLVELHEGSVEAKSGGASRGAEFVVRLPIPRTPPAAASPERERNPRLVSQRRVLVVDDNVDAAVSLALLLTAVGHEVKVAHAAPEAIELAPSFLPQVVVADIAMPGMDGYKLAQELRNLPATRSALLVALSGYGREEDRQHALAAGFDDHLVKPADVAQIQRRISEHDSEDGTQKKKPKN